MCMRRLKRWRERSKERRRRRMSDRSPRPLRNAVVVTAKVSPRSFISGRHHNYKYTFEIRNLSPVMCILTIIFYMIYIIVPIVSYMIIYCDENRYFSDKNSLGEPIRTKHSIQLESGYYIIFHYS